MAITKFASLLTLKNASITFGSPFSLRDVEMTIGLTKIRCYSSHAYYDVQKCLLPTLHVIVISGSYSFRMVVSHQTRHFYCFLKLRWSANLNRNSLLKHIVKNQKHFNIRTEVWIQTLIRPFMWNQLSLQKSYMCGSWIAPHITSLTHTRRIPLL